MAGLKRTLTDIIGGGSGVSRRETVQALGFQEAKAGSTTGGHSPGAGSPMIRIGVIGCSAKAIWERITINGRE